MSSREGSQFGPYLLRRLLGRGGFGEVYEAEDTVMHRVVALKLLSSNYSENPAFRERLFREARTAGRLHDPHVVPIHNCGEIDGQLYIDMRLVDGTDLQTVLQSRGPLGPERAVNVTCQIADALDAAHAETVIHRDVKPANILLSSDDFACLVDFGLANAATDTKLTSEGTTIGSFAYLAPERLASGEVTPAADTYALACVLYECLTGEAPYEGRTEIPALVAAHLTAPPPRPSQQRPGIPVGFDAVIARGMAKDAEDRYRSAGELAAAARQALKTPVVKHNWAPTTAPWTPAVPPSAFQPKSRRRTVLTVGAVALVAVIGAAVALVAQRSGPGRPAASGTAHPSSSTAAAPAPGAAFPPMNATLLPVKSSGLLQGVAVDSTGAVYVADETRVLKLAAGAAGPSELPLAGLYQARTVAVDEAGNVYVTDRRQDVFSDRVTKLAAGTNTVSELPFGAFVARGMTVDAAGNVYVADVNRVLELAVGASVPTELPFGGSAGYKGVAVDGAGTVYALQSGGVLKLAAGAAAPTQLPFGKFDQATSIALDSRGNIYVTDSNIGGKGRIVKLAPGAPTSTQLYAPDSNEFGGIAVDAVGNIYLSEGNRLLKVEAGS